VKTICAWLQKGGTGKSSTAGNVAYYLRDRGRVLLIDADPQANLTGWIGPESFKHELTDVLERKANLADAIVNVRENLDLLPLFAIGGNLKTWAETILPGKPFAFSDLRDKVKAAGYDFLVYDLSPGCSILERSIVATADEVLPIVRPEVFSVDGLEIFQDTIDRIRTDLRSTVKASRLAVNGYNASFGIHVAYLDKLKPLQFDIFTIGQSIKVSEAQAARQFIGEYHPKDKTLPEYQRLAQEL